MGRASPSRGRKPRLFAYKNVKINAILYQTPIFPITFEKQLPSLLLSAVSCCDTFSSPPYNLSLVVLAVGGVRPFVFVSRPAPSERGGRDGGDSSPQPRKSFSRPFPEAAVATVRGRPRPSRLSRLPLRMRGLGRPGRGWVPWQRGAGGKRGEAALGGGGCEGR